LVYASKNREAAGMMKNILRAASSAVREGVGSGEHDPRIRESPASLFSGLYEVEDRLLTVYTGREIRFGTLLQEEAHTQYTETNYRDAILKLERERRVKVDPPAE
jgi:hypothetical protein